MATRRQPEENVEVYQLGHWEQMQLALALALATKVLKVEAIGPEQFELLEVEGVERWLDLFGTSGRVTFLKEVDPQ